MKLPLDGPVAPSRPTIDLGSDISSTIMRTVEAGWVRAKKWYEVNTDAYEVSITERLRDGMRQALQHEKASSMVVLAGTESRSHSDVLLPDGRTDIPILWIEIFLRFGEHDPHAIIECKRIAGKNASLCRAYVQEGIDRFRTGKYAGNHTTGFMIGYLISGTAKTAANGINRYLDHKSRNQENLKPSGLIGEQWAWQSQHPRTQPASAIALHHAFLSF